MILRNTVLIVTLVWIGAVGGLQAAGQSEEDQRSWSNSTDLSIVVTEGNSGTGTYGLKNTLKKKWGQGRFQLLLDSVRTEDADDRFVLVEPGVTWLPGEEPVIGVTSIIDPPVEVDVERYFIEGRYDREITKRLEWHAGGSWDTNEDAGILNRYIAFGGLGNVWRDEEGLEFSTSYGLSFTDREEEDPDPMKDDSFLGVRLSWDYLNQFGKATVFESDFTSNVSLRDSSDYSLDMTNAVGVTLSEHLSLKVSLQWLYANEPALEEVDLVAFVILVDPDTIPGSGDEFFETVSTGGFELEIGDSDIRKKELDTIFRTSLVINF